MTTTDGESEKLKQEQDETKYTQEEIDRIVRHAQRLCFTGYMDRYDVEVDRIHVSQQDTHLSPNDEGGIWVRAWVHVCAENALCEEPASDDEPEPGSWQLLHGRSPEAGE